MRYFVQIDLKKQLVNSFSFKNTVIKEFLTNENYFSPEKYLSVTTLSYDRNVAGLLEKNWHNPIYNDNEYFLFVGGSVLYRNKLIETNNYAPSPADICKIILKYGDGHYEYLKGNYYIIFLEKANMEISIFSSPMFMHPAFFALKEGAFTFSNSLEALSEQNKLTIDNQGLVEFSLFDHCINGRTLYNELKSIQGGTCTILNKNGYNTKTVYDITKWYSPNPISKKQALIQIQKSLKTSISAWINSTDKFNVSLTGGFDGRLNFSFIEESQYYRLVTRSYGLKGSSQITIPNAIAHKLGFKSEPIYLDGKFEERISELGLKSIFITGGISGFNRAMYPYAYNIMKDFSRSCMLGQCDMIRPLFNNPAGVVFNEFSDAIFFEDFNSFKNKYYSFRENSFIDKSYYTDEIMNNIYNEVKNCYIIPYKNLSVNLRYYFFMLKESLMKYWHTEFHLVDIFVDDYVSFADLDYLEQLFNSKYAGIYKGLLAKSQFARKSPHDLYVDLMSLNNNKLNYIKNDRNIKPGWLKFGMLGWLFSAFHKKMYSIKKNKNDTFDAENWFRKFIEQNQGEILKSNSVFNEKTVKEFINVVNSDQGMTYRFNRMVSLKLWLQKSGIQ